MIRSASLSAVVVLGLSSFFPSANQAGTWVQTTGVPPSVNVFSTVTCTSNTFCLATDDWLNSAAGKVPAQGLFGEVWRGHQWEQTNSVPLNVPGVADVALLGCLNPKDCVALASSSYASRWNGSKWSSFEQIDGAFMAQIDALSCNAHFCLAIDTMSGSGLVYNGSSWSQPAVVDPTLARHRGTTVAISCPAAATKCVLLDNLGTTEVIGLDGVSRRTPQVGMNKGGWGWTFSCGSLSSCIAGGYSATGSGYWLWNGKKWSEARSETAGSLLGVGPALVSCPSASFCGSFTIPGPWSIYNGRAWEMGGTSSPLGGLNARALSCPTPSFCMAVTSGDTAWEWKR